MRKSPMARGISFLEIMVAILVITLGIILILNIFPISLRHHRRTKDMTTATFLLQGKMEELRDCGDNIPDDQIGEYPVPDNSPFVYQVEKKKVWNSDYDEVKVSVSKPEKDRKGKIALVPYAYASSLAGEKKIADFDSVVVGVVHSDPSASSKGATLYFISDPQARCIRWSYAPVSINPGAISSYLQGSGKDGVNPPSKSWKKLDVHPVLGPYYGLKADLPDGGVPGKIEVCSTVTAALYGPVGNLNKVSAYQGFPLFISVTDTENKCIWGGVIGLTPGAGTSSTSGISYENLDIHLSVDAKNSPHIWTKVCDSLP